MRSIIRLIVAGAAALPLLIGAAGVASASEDSVEYDHGTVGAVHEGAFVHEVSSGASDEGVAYFEEEYLYAGEEGAGFWGTSSWVDGSSAGYHEEWGWAGEHGAILSHTDANANGGEEEEEGDEEEEQGNGEEDQAACEQQEEEHGGDEHGQE